MCVRTITQICFVKCNAPSKNLNDNEVYDLVASVIFGKYIARKTFIRKQLYS